MLTNDPALSGQKICTTYSGSPEKYIAIYFALSFLFTPNVIGHAKHLLFLYIILLTYHLHLCTRWTVWLKSRLPKDNRNLWNQYWPHELKTTRYDKRWFGNFWTYGLRAAIWHSSSTKPHRRVKSPLAAYMAQLSQHLTPQIPSRANDSYVMCRYDEVSSSHEHISLTYKHILHNSTLIVKHIFGSVLWDQTLTFFFIIMRL